MSWRIAFALCLSITDDYFSHRYGIYPLTAFAAKQPPAARPRAVSPETAESIKSVTPEPIDIETRRVVNMMCNVKPREDGCDSLVSIQQLRDTRKGFPS